MMHLLCVVLLAAFVPMQVLAARPLDEIRIKAFNTSLYISNEKYRFVLEPQYQVPLQITRHIIYTSTTDNVVSTVKRTLWQNKKRLVQLAPEDYQILADYMGDEMPPYVKIDSTKRSIPADQNGVVAIPLADGYALLSFPNPLAKTLKRGVPVANSVCLHAPFFTNCDNEGDLDNLKDTLKIQQASFYAELDSYKDTNNARANELTNVLNRQRNLISDLLRATDGDARMLARIGSAAAMNAAQLAHGDYIAHAQITYLQRVTNSLLRFSNSMASTDARAVVAQPSLTTLFIGYKSVLEYLVRTGDIPIVDKRTFNWTEKPLPTGLVSNKEPSPGELMTKEELISYNLLNGFGAVTTVCCNLDPLDNYPPNTLCPEHFPGTTTQRSAQTGSGTEWIFGPHHPKHKGIFPMIDETNLIPATFYDNVIAAKADATSKHQIRPLPAGNDLFCIDFLGYKMLASFNSTPGMSNGIPTPAVADWSDCSQYMFRKSSATIYYLYAMWDGVAVPFYSNCRPEKITLDTGTSTPMTYLMNYPLMVNSTFLVQALTVPSSQYRRLAISDYDVNQRHWISDTCYMNIEPQWIGLEYSYKKVANVTTDVPRGYKLNQFTINPAGELASSIEFVYTQAWAWVYKVNLIPGNVVVVDEVAALDQSLVLFHILKDTIVDESDSFFGKSNNGRDCIQKADEYNYDITSCFFQNIETTYTVDKYIIGQARTTGIARYADKFQFSLANDYITFSPITGVKNFTSFSFLLTPKSDSDFTYSIVYEENVCPKLVPTGSSSRLDGCTYVLSYRGNKPIFSGVDPASATRLTFDANNRTITTTAPKVPLTVYVGFNDASSACITLQCDFSSNSPTPTFISTTQKTVEIASASKAALAASVKSTIDQTATDTITKMSKLTADVAKSLDNIKNLSAQLDSIDFNVSRIIPYENFTELRQSITNLINNIGTTAKNGCASGPFGDFGCLLQDIFSTLIVIAVIIAIGLGVYCICFKLGVGKKLIKILK